MHPYPPKHSIPTCEALESRQLLAVDVLTYHFDNARTGLNAREATLTPANVNSTSFGKLFVDSVDGKVDAQPLYVSHMKLPGVAARNVLYVATEHDSLYAFDADTGALYWQISALPAGETPSDPRNCTQIIPEIGITATPVIDRRVGAHGTLYLVAMSKDAAGNYHQRLHAIDLRDGAEEFGGPVEISGSYPGLGPQNTNGFVTFDPGNYEERSALLLSHGIIYTTWASHCDHPAFTGWMIGYSERGLKQKFTLNVNPNGNPGGAFLTDGSGGAFWNSAAGPATDLAGNIFDIASNGPFDTNLNPRGFPGNGDLGDSFLRVSANGKVQDYFSPFNQQALADADLDLGSGGPLILPAMTDASGNVRRLVVGAGKDGNIYLLNRSQLGKFNSTFNHIYQQVTGVLQGGEWATSAYFNGGLYYGPVGNQLMRFQFHSARLIEAPTSKTAMQFTYPGTTPAISSRGDHNGIVWAVENQSNSALHAYDARDLSVELYNSTQAGDRDTFGAGNKFITPVIANGKVFVATQSDVGVFGLLK